MFFSSDYWVKTGSREGDTSAFLPYNFLVTFGSINFTNLSQGSKISFQDIELSLKTVSLYFTESVSGHEVGRRPETR